jgi:hypothetical protein
MKFAYPLAVAAALAFACSHGNSSTKTATNDTGMTQSSSMNGSATTAGTTNGTQGTDVAAPGAVANNSVPADGNSAAAINGTNSQSSSPSASISNGSSHGTNTDNPNNAYTTGSGSQTPVNGPSYGSNGNASLSNGDTHGTNNNSGTSNAWNQNPPAQSGASYGSSPSASMSDGSSHGTNNTGVSGSATADTSATADSANMRTVTGSVAKVDSSSITLDQAAGGVTLTVDSTTQVVRKGHSVSSGISAIHEGEKVRASFDPTSNRAGKIELMGHHKMKHSDSTSSTDSK